LEASFNFKQRDARTCADRARPSRFACFFSLLLLQPHHTHTEHAYEIDLELTKVVLGFLLALERKDEAGKGERGRGRASFVGPLSSGWGFARRDDEIVVVDGWMYGWMGVDKES